jgi:hypothetical protein
MPACGRNNSPYFKDISKLNAAICAAPRRHEAPKLTARMEYLDKVCLRGRRYPFLHSNELPSLFRGVGAGLIQSAIIAHVAQTARDSI